MRKLQVLPSQSGYSAELAENTRRAQLEGGPSRTRLDFVGGVATVSASWNLPMAGFTYLQAFYRTATQQASEEFLVDLILDEAPLREYTAKFIPGSWRITNVRGGTTTVAAALEVKPLPVDEATDEAVMDAYEVYGEDVTSVFDALERLVNFTAPAAIPGSDPL